MHCSENPGLKYVLVIKNGRPLNTFAGTPSTTGRMGSKSNLCIATEPATMFSCRETGLIGVRSKCFTREVCSSTHRGPLFSAHGGPYRSHHAERSPLFVLFLVGGMWSVVTPVPPGAHEFKFIVDGEWKHSNRHPTIGIDETSLNNVRVVLPEPRIESQKTIAEPPAGSIPLSKTSRAGSRASDTGMYLAPRIHQKKKMDLGKPRAPVVHG